MTQKEILPSATTWVDLEGIMIKEISQIKTNGVWYHLYEELKQTQSHKNRREKRLPGAGR